MHQGMGLDVFNGMPMRRAVHALVATPDQRERLWPKAVATYSGYRGYQERTAREIPLVILEPRRASASG